MHHDTSSRLYQRYLIAREGVFRRFRDHRRIPRAEAERHFGEEPSAITVLIPLYAEEPGVVRATLLSAAPQEFPDLHIVLLLDDNPKARGENAARTRRTFTVVDEIRKVLKEPQQCTRDTLASYEQRFGDVGDDEVVNGDDILELSAAYSWVANGWTASARLSRSRITYPSSSSNKSSASWPTSCARPA